MIPGITEVNFPQYATLHQANATFAEMGDRTIATQVRIDGDVVPDFDGWELVFKGERFVLPIKDPQAMKDNSTRNSLVDLSFESWAILQMKRYYFFQLPATTAGIAVPDQYVASMNLPIEQFVSAFNGVLAYYFGENVIRMDLYEGTYSTDPVLVEMNYSHIWDVLTKLYDLYGYRWRIEKVEDTYVIKVNYPAESIEDHDFEYGYQGGLLKFERQVQDATINNILLGRGGEKNLPYRYFKRTDEQNPGWPADPDAIYELRNIYFDRLRDINFRWYVRGWMQNPNRNHTWEQEYPAYTYPIYTESQCPADSLFAFRKGKTDTSFRPVEYVQDESSIAAYGERWGAVDNNDEIYPTIQGLSRDGIGRVDETVAVSEIITDDVDEAASNAATEDILSGRKEMFMKFEPGGTGNVVGFTGELFKIPAGMHGNLQLTGGTEQVFFIPEDGLESTAAQITITSKLIAIDERYGDSIDPPVDLEPNVPYHYVVNLTVKNHGDQAIRGTVGFNGVKLIYAEIDADAWKPTFDIWVKNIWDTQFRDQEHPNESAVQYADRVWAPILGDRVGNEAKLVFSTGPMSISQDYEFTIAAIPVRDTSKSIDGVSSEWRITLRKSDAELDATGLFIPNATQGGQPQAGNKFFFTGIDMPNMYVTENETKLSQYKKTELGKVSAINPTWVITLDKIRVHTLEDGEYETTLADRLSAGCTVKTTGPRFTPGAVLTLYVQSISYTWNEGDQLPNIEVVLAQEVLAYVNQVEKIAGDVSFIRTNYVRAADLESAIRKVSTPMFLKKTGEEDLSNSPTIFASMIRSKDFKQGDTAGKGWAHYKDGEGASVMETDKIVVRKELRVNTLVANQIAYVGGKQINSAASIQCEQVEEVEDGYKCYFDQKQGTVANLFRVDDIAMGQVFDAENIETSYYRCLVTEVGEDYIILSDTDRSGTGIPKKGDTIVQYGNVSDANRQYVIIRDVIGGGHERMLSGLNAVDADGDEYYFAGIEAGEPEFVTLQTSDLEPLEDSDGKILGFMAPTYGPRWFVGNKNGHYAEWLNGTFTVKGNIIVTGGNLQYLMDAMGENSGDQGGVILSQFMGVRDANDHVVAGMNGSHTLTGWQDSAHGVLMIAAGIPETHIDQPAIYATTRIFADGFIHCSNLEANGGAIGPFNINATPAEPTDTWGYIKAYVDDGVGCGILSLSPGRLMQSMTKHGDNNNLIGINIGIEPDQIDDSSLAAAYFKNLRTATIAGAAGNNFGVDIDVNAEGMVNTGLKIQSRWGTKNYGLDVSAVGASTYNTTENCAAKLVASGTVTTNYGLYVSASGATNNYGIYCAEGVFGGLRPKVIESSASAINLSTAANRDAFIVVSTGSGVSITLPSSPKVGETYMIFHNNNSGLSFSQQVRWKGATIAANSNIYSGYAFYMVTYTGSYWALSVSLEA